MPKAAPTQADQRLGFKTKTRDDHDDSKSPIRRASIGKKLADFAIDQTFDGHSLFGWTAMDPVVSFCAVQPWKSMAGTCAVPCPARRGKIEPPPARLRLNLDAARTAHDPSEDPAMSKPKHIRILFAAAFGLAIASAAHARSGGGCDDEFGCGTNGIWENGVALDGVVLKNLRPDPATPIIVAEERAGPSAEARTSCPTWGCGENGIWQNGVSWHGLRLEALDSQRVQIVLPAAK